MSWSGTCKVGLFLLSGALWGRVHGRGGRRAGRQRGCRGRWGGGGGGGGVTAGVRLIRYGDVVLQKRGGVKEIS